MANTTESPTLYRYGDLVVDLGRYRVLLDGQPVALSYREYALLVYLAARCGQAVSRRQLLEEGLGRHDPGGLRAVDEHIRHLKHRLEGDGRMFIEAVGDSSYRFIKSVHSP